MIPIKYLTIIFSVFLILSCKNTKATVSLQDTTSIEIPSGLYVIKKLGVDNTLPNGLTLEFEKATNKISGFSGCNHFFGNYKTNGNTITFGALASTRKLCQGETNIIEAHILGFLGDVNLFSFENNTLKLKKGSKTLIKASLNTTLQITQDSDYTFDYLAVSRGIFNHIVINNSTISVQKNRDSKPITKACSKADWDKLMSLLKTIDAENLSKLEAPSKAHQYDGAAIAHLKIVSDNVTYETESFDHGNPPKAIASFVKEILSLSENIE